MESSDAVDEAQVANDRAVGARNSDLNCLPIDRAAVRH
jgi:hypothetical protein